MNAAQRILENTERLGDKPCVVDAASSGVLTYAQLARRAAETRSAVGTDAAGRICLVFMPQVADAVAVFAGLMSAGAIPAFMPLPSPKQDPAIYWESHRALLDLIEPHAIVASAETFEAMRQAGLVGPDRREIALLDPAAFPAGEADPSYGDEEEVAFLQHSSGTTGLKKGVAITHRALERQVDRYAETLGATEEDVIATWLPLYHDMGLIACTLMPLLLGQTIVMLDPFAWAADPASLFSAIDRHAATLVWQPNFAFEHLVRTVQDGHTSDLSSVRAWIDCSEPCKPETFDRFAGEFGSLGVRRESLQACYAMAETVFAATQTEPGVPAPEIRVDPQALSSSRDVVLDDSESGRRLLSSGRALPGVEIAVADESGALLPPNKAGELVIRCDFLFDEYYRRPDATAEKLRDGWYHSSDLGFVADGEVYVLGRLDDLIIVHGRNYFAHDIEQVLSRVEGLKPGRAVAFGVPNARLETEEMVVVAERADAADDADRALKTAVRRAVFDHAGVVLNDIRIVGPGSLVKTTSGKISRKENRARYLSSRSTDLQEVTR